MLVLVLLVANTFFALVTLIICLVCIFTLFVLVEQASLEFWLDNKDAYRKAKQTKNKEDPVFVGERLGFSGWYKVYKPAEDVIKEYCRAQETKIFWQLVILVALVATNGLFYLGRWFQDLL